MIAKTFTDSFVEVQKLVNKFHKHIDEYLKPKYQEAEVRQDFLDKFFVALGWDVYHHENSNPYEREVRIEKSVMVQGRGKRADYAFYTAPNFAQARFMAEAKKPSKQLENAQDCFQAIRYGWNSNTPISVLTDFEQFFVLDSRYKPTIETATQRIIREQSYKYTDYADEEKFREIYYLFSREAVLNNSLETFAKSLKGGRGAKQSKLFNTSIIQPMDEEFLSELDEQRVVLAKAFKNRNYDLDSEILTEITQRTLDRLVFLRFLEDKLVEPDSVIDNLGKKSGSAWRDFINEMPRLNKTYNGTLFKEHSLLDNPNFAPDERAFENTRDWLSHLNSPYDFNSIPIHILGSIYERFLGKTIVATDKRATVEDKLEVRKAGGVYYTPEYIVRYIVENTIGKLTEKKKPEEIAEMRFADIACGSGSFLLGVFDYLISYHVEWFSENKTRREKAVKDGLCRETIEGVLQLTIHYKREILTNNIYGVDLDAQAVEVAQLSLYLKLLEEETTATKQQFLAGFREQLLPSLNKNIVHGNSLIDYDIMDGMLFDTRELKQLNPMNFQSTFPEVFQKGGFDAVIGNPPYVRQELLGTTAKNYFQKKYETYHGVADLYVYFFEKYLSIIKQNGEFGIIVGSKWLRVKYGEPLRRFLKKQHIEEISDFGALPVFQGATTYPAIIRVRKSEPQSTFQAAEIETLDFTNTSLSEHINERKFNVIQSTLNNGGWSLNNETSQVLLDKLRKVGVSLKEYVNGEIYRGIVTGSNESFVIDKETRGRLISEDEKSAEVIKPFLAGRDVRRYVSPKSDKFVIFTRRGVDIKNYPAIENYLRQFYTQLLPKPENWEKIRKKDEKWQGRKGGKYQWFEIQDTVDYYPMFEETKILFPGISAEVTAFAMDSNKYYGNDNNQLIVTDDKYLLGILNSRLSRFLLTSICDKVQGGFYRLKIIYIEQLPIRTVDFSKPKEKAAHDKIVELVEKMLDAKKSLAAAQTDKDKTFYERFCASLDRQIDDLVYDLYDLTADEKKIIEGS